MFQHSTTWYTTYQFFNYARTEILAHQYCKLKWQLWFFQQSSAALHLQNVIKTFDMSCNEGKKNISEMKISISFSLSRGGQRVHTFWEKTTLILMHHLATCQDRVSSSHQALSSKYSGSDVLGDCDTRLFHLQKSSNSFFFKVIASFFWLIHKEDFAFQVQSNQQVTVINQQAY